MALERTWDTAPQPDVGTLGGECFRALCHKTGANWYHAKAARYYCASCAASLNEESWLKGEPPVCARHN